MSMPQRGRPAGEVRQVIFDTLRERGAMPLCDLVVETQVGYDACKLAVNNAVRAERLEIVGHEKRPHCKQWVAMYDVVDPAEKPASTTQPGIVLLDDTLRHWR